MMPIKVLFLLIFACASKVHSAEAKMTVADLVWQARRGNPTIELALKQLDLTQREKGEKSSILQLSLLADGLLAREPGQLDQLYLLGNSSRQFVDYWSSTSNLSIALMQDWGSNDLEFQRQRLELELKRRGLQVASASKDVEKEILLRVYSAKAGRRLVEKLRKSARHVKSLEAESRNAHQGSLESRYEVAADAALLQAWMFEMAALYSERVLRENQLLSDVVGRQVDSEDIDFDDEAFVAKFLEGDFSSEEGLRDKDTGGYGRRWYIQDREIELAEEVLRRETQTKCSSCVLELGVRAYRDHQIYEWSQNSRLQTGFKYFVSDNFGLGLQGPGASSAYRDEGSLLFVKLHVELPMSDSLEAKRLALAKDELELEVQRAYQKSKNAKDEKKIKLRIKLALLKKLNSEIEKDGLKLSLYSQANRGRFESIQKMLSLEETITRHEIERFEAWVSLRDEI